MKSYAMVMKDLKKRASIIIQDKLENGYLIGLDNVSRSDTDLFVPLEKGDKTVVVVIHQKRVKDPERSYCRFRELKLSTWTIPTRATDHSGYSLNLKEEGESIIKSYYTDNLWEKYYADTLDEIKAAEKLQYERSLRNTEEPKPYREATKKVQDLLYKLMKTYSLKGRKKNIHDWKIEDSVLKFRIYTDNEHILTLTHEIILGDE